MGNHVIAKSSMGGGDAGMDDVGCGAVCVYGGVWRGDTLAGNYESE